MSDLPLPPPPPPPPPPDHLAPPPGYVAYGGVPTGALGTPQGIGLLSKWLLGLIAAGLVMQVASLVAQLAARGAALDLMNDVISVSQFDDEFAMAAVAGALLAAVSIAQIVVLIIWTFRLAKNLTALGRPRQSFKPGATIAVNILGGCTLGILNFYMWRELWAGSDPDTAPHDPNWKQRAISPLVVANLVVGLLATVVSIAAGIGSGFAAINTNGSRDIADNLADRLGLVLLTSALQIGVAVVFLMLVKALSVRHMKAIHET